MSKRPVCVHCGNRYGSRAVEHQSVRWETPVKQHIRRGWGGRPDEVGYLADGPITDPPPYKGNGILVKQSNAYVSGDNGDAVMTRYVWDGESYRGGYKPFCTLHCALDYARKAYKART